MLLDRATFPEPQHLNYARIAFSGGCTDIWRAIKKVARGSLDAFYNLTMSDLDIAFAHATCNAQKYCLLAPYGNKKSILSTIPSIKI